MALISALNRDVPPARAGEFPPLRLGSLELPVPVVLAPMAGVTNAAFRVLCRRFGRALYVSEMITARGVVEGNRKTMQLAAFRPEERPRSLQLYGTSEPWLEQAARILVGEHGVEHLDLNLGCPVRKITAQGGGSALPLKPRLLARLIGALVRGAHGVPVTVKMRLGLDDSLLTFLTAGRIAEAEGAAWVGLHARTAAQLYDGEARWAAIGELAAALRIPVLGNGDVWEAADALRMLRQTGCAGVIVGRGCLGRPWLFGELEDVFLGRAPRHPPCFAEVRAVALEHARLLAELFGERPAMAQMRKHAAWYTKAFPGGAQLRPRLMTIQTLAELDALLGLLPADTPFPVEGLRVRRGKKSGVQKVSLPPGWLDSDDVEAGELPPEAVAADGG